MGCISGEPWLCFGHFDEVLYSFKKKGGNIRHLAEMDAFRQVSESCSLYDITASGPKFMCKKLQKWNWLKFGHIQHLLRQKKFRLKELQVRDSDDTEEQTMLHQEIKELLTREEILWRQHSRIQWSKKDALAK
nr:reverse transcriptase [Tanacetum cinerariifolium]